MLYVFITLNYNIFSNINNNNIPISFVTLKNDCSVFTGISFATSSLSQEVNIFSVSESINNIALGV